MDWSADFELRTERLLLRLPRPDDAERLAQIANDIRIARNMTARFPHPYTLDDAEKFVAAEPSGLLIELLEPATEADIGMIGLVGGGNLDDPYEGVHGFGYWLGVNYWGHGYATEAAQAYLDHVTDSAPDDRPLRRVEASIYGWNPISGNVLEKLGLQLEGRRRNRVLRFGDVTDELLYGRTLD